jgi:hypothetical protein
MDAKKKPRPAGKRANIGQYGSSLPSRYLLLFALRKNIHGLFFRPEPLLIG